MSNIINNPTKIEKYGNLKAKSIIQKLDQCLPAVTILFLSGFESSNDDTRLIWVNTTDNMITIKYIHNTLTSLINPISKENINDNNQNTELIFNQIHRNAIRSSENEEQTQSQTNDSHQRQSDKTQIRSKDLDESLSSIQQPSV